MDDVGECQKPVFYQKKPEFFPINDDTLKTIGKSVGNVFVFTTIRPVSKKCTIRFLYYPCQFKSVYTIRPVLNTMIFPVLCMKNVYF